MLYSALSSKNTIQQANKLNLLTCGSIPIRSFHITWVTLFWCHFAWFCTTNILREINNDFPLTIAQQQLASSLSVTSTVLFRVVIAILCPKYGPRKTYVLVLFCTIVTLGALALVQTSVAFIIIHIFLGIAGSAFVVTEYHTTQLFTEKIVGSAQAITAGFGIFGGGTVNFIGPIMVYYLGWSWHMFLASVAAILFLLCFIYYFGSKDNVQSVGSHPVQSGSFYDAFYEYRTWVLFACYAVCRGVEIVFYIVAAQYFQIEYGISEIESGFIVMMWSSMNLWARPLGGHLCDKYEIPQRAKILFVLLFLESICIILFGAAAHWSSLVAIVSCMMFSICIQMAEGATFSIVAFVRPRDIGHVIGIVSSGGNVGAAFFIFAIFVPWNYSRYDMQYSWVVLGVVVMILSFCALMIQFTRRELHDSKRNMNECFDICSSGGPVAGVNCVDIGLSVGGAKDINNFRECIKNNIKPSTSSITYNGLFYDYYFDTTTSKHANAATLHDDDGSKLFYPSYCYAKVKKQICEGKQWSKMIFSVLSDDVKESNAFEYYLSVGLNSCIKQDEFRRKRLNLVIVLDQSGSMNGCFGYTAQSTKMEIANQSVNALLKHLTKEDRFGMVLFNTDCTVLQEIKFVNDINMNELQDRILSITANGGTNFEAGYNGAIDLYKKMYDGNPVDDDYDNRIIFLTDAQPNRGYTAADANVLLAMASKCADGKIEFEHGNDVEVQNRIYTTFIGVGLDFNSSLIEAISSTRGCNYYSVKSAKDFKEVMDDDFEFMVTPLVFSVVLRLKCEGSGCVIEKVYGSSDGDGGEDHREVTRIHTLFPSKKSADTGETKGGMQLIKLKKIDDSNKDMNVEIEVEFEDRNGKKYKNVQFVSLKTPCDSGNMNALNDMIELEQYDENETVNYYDNTGIRKAILLCKYVDLMKDWIKSSTNENAKYKLLFEKFVKYFKYEMGQCKDDSLQKESDLIQSLITTFF